MGFPFRLPWQCHRVGTWCSIHITNSLLFSFSTLSCFFPLRRLHCLEHPLPEVRFKDLMSSQPCCWISSYSGVSIVVQLPWFWQIHSSFSSGSKQSNKCTSSSWTAWLENGDTSISRNDGKCTPNDKRRSTRRSKNWLFEEREPQGNVCKETVMTEIDKTKIIKIGMGNRLRLRRSGSRIPESPRDFSVLQNIQTLSGAHWAPYFMITGVLSQG